MADGDDVDRRNKAVYSVVYISRDNRPQVSLQ
jgi:hypothetical protein